MNTAKISNYNKLIAFFLIIVALLSVLVVSANGWQDDSPFWDDESDLGNSDINDKKDPEKSPTDGKEPDAPTETQKYYHHITGIEIQQEKYGDSQIAYVIDGNSPLCGVTDCNVLIEFPIESGKTRYVMISDKGADLVKIGSITYSRYFISNLASSFGATVISLGNDDAVEYEHVNWDEHILDLKSNAGSYYTEYTYFTYTSSKLIAKTILSAPTLSSILPYNFTEGTTDPTTKTVAETINLPYENSTSLVYSPDQGKYCLCKHGSDKIDVSTPKKVEFTNIFVLYADSMTYETADKTQVVINTLGSGKGYYAFEGYAEEITWCMDNEGNLTFKDTNGEKVHIGRGSTYIAYVKSSKSNVEIFQ